MGRWRRKVGKREFWSNIAASFSGSDSERMADFAARKDGNGVVWVEKEAEMRVLEWRRFGFLRMEAIDGVDTE